MIDESGLLSQHFGAATSGQCYLFDAHGSLLFSGGITEGTRSRRRQSWCRRNRSMHKRESTKSAFYASLRLPLFSINFKSPRIKK